MPELPKGYDPSLVEDKWYAEWLAQGHFTADPARAFNGNGLTEEQKKSLRAKGLKEAFSIVIPPPNVTGILHMGHVLNNTIQDILARRKRMQGFEVLWLPGIDHAGIATQTKVEQQLRKEERKTRHQLGREEFLRRVWTWKDKHGGIILQQLKKLGCSCDWSRTVFTMDGLDPRDPNPRINYSKWISYVFVKLYEKGFIYRGRRMVNWCVVSNTALSDEEVIMKETRGHLWHIRYPLAQDSTKNIVVATTRPETMLGDTAVAVNPNDERYKHLIGQKLILPLSSRQIPIIADQLVDPKFGTGCVKVTPAHDPADFEMGQRHNLEQIQVIGFDGKMTDRAGENYAGLDRYECREKVIADLQEINLIEKIEDYTHNVGFSERADVPAEPMVSDQWFLKYPATKESLAAALDGRIRFRPDHWLKVYEKWMLEIRDWCISRQLWWGHRIPVWTRMNPQLSPQSPPEIYCGMEAPKGDGWIQDPDVLDTWFSSWLWPFATMIQDPDRIESEFKNPKSEVATFYPTKDMVTAPEILFFWVARMIMAGFEFTKAPCFSDVYLHGTVRDRQGRKMSKQLGNSPDPLDLISKFGADGVRFGTMRCAPLGLDVRFDEQQVELGRNFCNKLWNAVRLRLSQKSEIQISFTDLKAEDLTSDDKAILMQLDEAIREIDQAFTTYEFHQVTNRLYDLFWFHYCDRHLETTKVILYGSDDRAKAVTLCIMDYVLSNTLKLLHPFMPFITEELWHALGFGKSTIQFESWPVPLTEAEKHRLGLNHDTAALVNLKHESVTGGRNLKASYNIPTNKKTRFLIQPASSPAWHQNTYEVEVLKTLLNAESIEFVDAAPKGSASALTPFGQIYLPLEGLVDVAAETSRLQNQIGKLEKELENVSAKLADTGFTSRAPKEAVEKHRLRADQLKLDIEKIRSQILTLKS